MSRLLVSGTVLLMAFALACPSDATSVPLPSPEWDDHWWDGVCPWWPEGGHLVKGYVAEYASAPAVGQAVQWSGNAHWYEPVLAELTWEDARVAAEGRGGYLATIASAEENDFVFGLAAADLRLWGVEADQWTIGPWLGGTDKDTEALWEWVSGEPWGYDNWAGPQPDNMGNQDYLIFWGPAGSGAPPVPEPASCALLGLAVGGVGVALRKRRGTAGHR